MHQPSWILWFWRLAIEPEEGSAARTFMANELKRVEKGATWIHGIEGSPVYAIAKQIGAMEDREKPWECMDEFRHNSAVLAGGGLVVP